MNCSGRQQRHSLMAVVSRWEPMLHLQLPACCLESWSGGRPRVARTHDLALRQVGRDLQSVDMLLSRRSLLCYGTYSYIVLDMKMTSKKEDLPYMYHSLAVYIDITDHDFVYSSDPSKGYAVQLSVTIMYVPSLASSLCSRYPCRC
jgi:hypothetical protein